jgi:catalase
MSGVPVPALVRFSNGSGHPRHPDTLPGVHGMAVKFTLPDGSRTDISAQTAGLFVAKDVAGFLEFLKATEIGPTSLIRLPLFTVRHPEFLRTLRANAASLVVPRSYATVAYHALHAFRWLDDSGGSRFVRYHWSPLAGTSYLSHILAARHRRDFLVHEIKARLARGPARFDLQVQIAGPGDSTTDPSAPWAATESVTVGTLEVRALETQRDTQGDVVVFDPMRVTDGIEPSNDPVLRFRTGAYSVSVEQRSGIARGPEAPPINPSS